MCVVECNHDLLGNNNFPKIQVGDTVTVSGEMDFDGKHFYCFLETGVGHYYDATAFSPISGISNEEIEEENQDQEADHLQRVWEGIVREMDKMENA